MKDWGNYSRCGGCVKMVSLWEARGSAPYRYSTRPLVAMPLCRLRSRRNGAEDRKHHCAGDGELVVEVSIWKM